jgi:molybdopterin-containing oxidoreductase family membrane subunit
VLAVFRTPGALLAALQAVRRASFERVETYAPMRLREAEAILGQGPSPVRYWTLIGAAVGCAGGFALAIGSALVNGLVAGGKHPVSIIPYCIVGFEGAILVGTLANLAGMFVHCRLGRAALPPSFDTRFTRDRFGLFIACGGPDVAAARGALESADPEEVHVIP